MRFPSLLLSNKSVPGSTGQRDRHAILSALLVALVFLAGDLLVLNGRIQGMAASDALNKKITHASLFGPHIVGDLVKFLLAIALLHVMLGVAGWLVARACRAAIGVIQHVPAAIVSAVSTFLLFAWAYTANAVTYPWSTAGGGFSSLGRFQLGGISVFAAFSLALVALLVWVGVRATVTSRAYAKLGPRVFVYPTLALALFGAWRISALAHASETSVSTRPHVILIGVDSLRPDVVAMGRAIGLTPNIDRFISESVHFENALTPLARTFPSWITMLTGQHPTNTGVRENLLSPADLTLPPTLGDVLKSQGYHAVYATDDVRCSNIDESYGFDKIVGPKMGALDFLLGAINDLPLPNLIMNTWAGKLLFPYNYVNRAAAVTYELETFVEEVGSTVDFEQPTFLAVHLTLPHFPYYWARDNTGSLAESLRQPYMYSNSIIGVDRQVGLLLEMLERKGALNNAIVVLLSDHGEALGLPQDNLLYSKEAKQAARGITVQMWGHGNSTLSPGQFRVLFSWRGFGAADGTVGRGRLDTPVSLEDLMPTALDVLDIPFAGSFDGLSLAPEVSGGANAAPRLGERVRFTETGITMGFNKLGDAKVDEIVQQGMSAYAINPVNGRLELRGILRGPDAIEGARRDRPHPTVVCPCRCPTARWVMWRSRLSVVACRSSWMVRRAQPRIRNWRSCGEVKRTRFASELGSA